MNKARVEELVRELLLEIGEDPEREGLQGTPRRVAESYSFLTKGYSQNLDQLVNGAIFTQESDNMVILRDIELYSLCEHHMLPFLGRCNIGYIPKNGRILGVSKIARIIDMYARRLQVQERLTLQVANAIMHTIEPEGVGVIIEARHLCMMMRGVEKQNSMMTTSSVLGSFHNSTATRNEFLSLINRSHGGM
jgi:GTP cyclohydrolase I